MSKTIAIIASVILGAFAARGQTRLLPAAPGDAIRLYSFVIQVVKLPHNSADSVAKEVQAAEIRRLLAHLLKVPDETRLRYIVGPGYAVEISTLGLTEQHVESLAGILMDYIQLRAGGHTARYVLDSLKQRLTEPKPETNGFRVMLFERFPHLPRAWVKQDPFQSPTVASTNRNFTGRFVVIDDRIAWVYSVRPGGGKVMEDKVDAREFDPKLRPKFEAAWQEAERTLAQRGIKKQLGYFRDFEAEVSSILQRKHGIRRMGFHELNPGVFVD